MAITFEEHRIENAVGSGNDRKYVQLRTQKAKTVDEIAEIVAHSCSATKSDVLAVMTELSHVAINELADGSRFYLPEIGYLSLKVGNTPADMLKDGEITGKDVYLRNVNFQPDSAFIKELREKVKFSKSKYTSLSMRPTEEVLWKNVEIYLTVNKHITRRIMCAQFGLSDHFAKLWLTRFVNEGKLVKEAYGRQNLYSLKQ